MIKPSDTVARPQPLGRATPAHGSARPLSRTRIAAVAAVGAAMAVALPVAAGCAPSRGVVDGGPVRTVVPPPTPQPLWPDQTLPGPDNSSGGATATRKAGPSVAPTAPPPTPVRAPTPLGDDARNIDIQATLLADPRVDDALKDQVRDCPESCGLRAPVYRDLTGDGRTELLVSISNDGGLTGTYAYLVNSGKIFNVFSYELDHYEVDGLGEDLLIRQAVAAPGDAACCPSLLYTTRYRWNGREMLAIGTETEFRQQPPPVPTVGGTSAALPTSLNTGSAP